MKFRRFLSSMVVADGGSIVCHVELTEGGSMFLGLDARIPKAKQDRVLFVGADYPSKPGARLLDRGSKEEKEVIDALQDYLDREAVNSDIASDLMSALNDR